jgi:hypothetical protein
MRRNWSLSQCAMCAMRWSRLASCKQSQLKRQSLSVCFCINLPPEFDTQYFHSHNSSVPGATVEILQSAS